MSSVRDRIRNLQAGNNDSQSNIVKSNAASVSQIAKSLEGGPSEGGSGSTAPESLGARVARFDAVSTPSSQAKGRPLPTTAKKSIPSSKSLAPSLLKGNAAAAAAAAAASSSLSSSHGVDSGPGVRRTASDNEDGRVLHHQRAKVAGHVATETSVHNARRVFEQQQQQNQVKQPVPLTTTKGDDKPTAASQHNGGSDGKQHATGKDSPSASIFSRAAVFEASRPELTLDPTAPKRTTTTTTTTATTPSKLKASKALADESMAVRTAMFGSEKDNERKGSNNSAVGGKDTTKKEKSKLNDEVAELKALNNKLVKSLLDLTENYQRLEQSRDNLQKRIMELEAEAK